MNNFEDYPYTYPTTETAKEETEHYNSTVMKVIGIGGAGCNAINRMIEDGVQYVDFIAANTDSQALRKNLADVKLQIGSRSTRGLGAGAKPEVGEKAATEDIEEIKAQLQGSDMVFITAGMGGGTGTGAAPIFARVAKEIGALTVAVVTLPFEFEGSKRFEVAQEGIQRLKEHVDTMLIISNSRIYKVIERRVGVKEAFKKIDDVLKQAVMGISSIISDTAEINVDFADVHTVLSNKGEAIMGIGTGGGDSRALDAARMALENPLIESTSFRNAGAMLVYIIGGADFGMAEFDEAARTVTEYCRHDAEIITGLNIDDNLKNKVKVIIVATDFQTETIQEQGTRPIAAEDIFERGKVIEMKEIQSNPNKFRTVSRRETVVTEPSNVSDDDLDIPAFLRRKNRKMG